VATAQPDGARRELNALTYITGKLDSLPTGAVVRVLAWARSAGAGTAAGNDELKAMQAVSGRLNDVTDAAERQRILRWLDEHYLADDAEPAGETVNTTPFETGPLYGDPGHGGLVETNPL
jgi:hypothetical protein